MLHVYHLLPPRVAFVVIEGARSSQVRTMCQELLTLSHSGRGLDCAVFRLLPQCFSYI